jgi:predicted component of type VI protein secretion system
MQLETVIVKLNRLLSQRLEDLSIAVTSGAIDNMENYKYIVGQIKALESVRQELSNLLNDKEQKNGTVVDIKNTPTK